MILCLVLFSCNTSILDGQERKEFDEHKHSLDTIILDKKEEKAFNKYVKEIQEADPNLFHGLDKRKFDLENPKKLVRQVEKYVRTLLPHPGNQIQDMISDPNTCSKTYIAKSIGKDIFHPKPEEFSIDNILRVCYFSYYFKGGNCNEYAYLSYATLIFLGVKIPFSFCTSHKESHSFVCLGDFTDPNAKIYMLDPWVIKRDVVLLSDTKIRESIEVVDTTTPREVEEKCTQILNHIKKAKEEPQNINAYSKLTKTQLEEMKVCWYWGNNFCAIELFYYRYSKKDIHQHIRDVETNKIKMRIKHKIRDLILPKIKRQKK